MVSGSIHHIDFFYDNNKNRLDGATQKLLLRS